MTLGMARCKFAATIGASARLRSDRSPKAFETSERPADTQWVPPVLRMIHLSQGGEDESSQNALKLHTDFIGDCQVEIEI